MSHVQNVTNINISHGGLIFEEEFFTLTKFIYHVWICIAIFGIAANTINITVFVKMASKDNVTITLLVLSASDLINLCLNAPRIVGRFMEGNYPNHEWPFNKFIIILGPFWYAYVFYDYSSFVSVFLAGVRCACVASPLRFKSMFTKSRTITVLCVLFLTALILRIPVLTIFRLTWAVNPRTNSSYRSIEISGDFRDIYRVNDILNRNIISWVTYVTVVTCVIILASKLKAASRFRQSLVNGGLGSDGSDKHKMADEILRPPRSYVPSDNTQKADHSKKSTEGLSAKDLQIIKLVTLICVIFILSQLPSQVVSTVRLFAPEFANNRSGQWVYGFMAHINNTCAYLNSSVNIFIHLRFNSKYRQTFLSLFSKK